MKPIKSESKKTTMSKPAVVKTPAKAAAKPAPVIASSPAPTRATTTQAPSAKAIAPAPVAALRSEITGESIASRAYLLWEQQGRPHGRDLENWLQAERQLKQSSPLFAA